MITFPAGPASVLSCNGDAIVLGAAFSAPPGKPLSGLLAGGLEVQLKVHGSQKQPDGSFVIRGRLVNASRAVKEALTAS